MKKEIFAWGMYDLANTIFSALFVTFFFPLYVKQYLGGNEFQLGLVFGLSMLAVGVIVPVIGAWSDRLGRRLPFIVFFTAACCIFAWLVAAVPLHLALLFGFLANFSYHAALTTYNALLPSIASRKELGKVSGTGVALGYLGTVIALLIAGIILYFYGWETKQGTQVIFAATAILFFVFALPLFFGVKEPRARVSGAVFESMKEVGQTLAKLSSHKKFVNFLLAMFFFTNAIFAVIIFLFPFAREQIHISVKMFFVLYTLQAIAAAIGSVVSGRFVDRYGPKHLLQLSAFIWIGVVLLLIFFPTLPVFFITGLFGGAALGMLWTAQRPQLIAMVKREKVGQFFGFLELAGKFSGILAMAFGALAHFLNYQAALALLVVSFLIGLWFLESV
ncbi:MAG TPA: MFS transporter [Candidatus Nanoarchaeia archaeon]|nr:MFS transporter [Candidatus Nanoarchaeia archaeon]